MCNYIVALYKESTILEIKDHLRTVKLVFPATNKRFFCCYDLFQLIKKHFHMVKEVRTILLYVHGEGLSLEMLYKFGWSQVNFQLLIGTAAV